MLALLASSTAFADAPSTWERTPQISSTFVLLVLGAIPVALFVLITLLVYLPSMRRGEQYQPGLVWRGQSEWFGGPGGGLETAGRTPPPAVGSDAGSEASRGGTGGHW